MVIYRNNTLKQNEELAKKTSIVSNNLKILKHNSKNVIDNGFFGL